MSANTPIFFDSDALNPRYEEYLRSKDWDRQKREAYARWGHFCNACGTEDYVTCHHLFYRNLYDCTPNDLMPLCRRCHTAVHQHPVYSTKEEGDHFEKRRQTIVRARRAIHTRARAEKKSRPPKMDWETANSRLRIPL